MAAIFPTLGKGEKVGLAASILILNIWSIYIINICINLMIKSIFSPNWIPIILWESQNYKILLPPFGAAGIII